LICVFDPLASNDRHDPKKQTLGRMLEECWLSKKQSQIPIHLWKST